MGGRWVLLYLLGFLTNLVRSEKNFFSLVGKCCAAEEVLWMTSGGIRCTLPSTNTTNKMLYFGYNTNPMYPQCKKVMVKEIKNENVPIRANCLDMFYNNMYKFENGRLVALMCEDDMSTLYTNSIIPRNHIIRLRTCCSDNEYFDFASRSCQPGGGRLKSIYASHLEKVVDFVGLYRAGPYCTNPMIDYQINIKDVSVRNNSLLIYNQRLNRTFDLSENHNFMCIEKTKSPSILITRMCWENRHCTNNACVRKCCPHDRNYQHPHCIPNSPVRRSNFHSAIVNDKSSKFDEFKKNFLFSSDYGLKTSLQCEYGERMVYDDWSLTLNGYARVATPNKLYTHDEYCIDLKYDSYKSEPQWILMICAENESWAFNKTNVLVTSCICLLLTIIYYSQFWSQQDAAYKRSLVCFLITTFYTCCLLIMTNIQSFTDLVKFEYIGYIAYFFMLSKNAWLTMMCWDTWKLTRSILKVEMIFNDERVIFTFYCLVAWGSALSLMLHVMFLTNFHLFKIINGSDVNFDEKWLIPGNNYRIYSYVVLVLLYMTIITILLISSISIYHRVSSLRTALIKHKKKLKVLRGRLYINITLYLVIGIPIMSEVSSKLSSVTHNVDDLSQQMINFLDLSTCSEGITILTSLILVPKIFDLLVKQFVVKRREVLYVPENCVTSNAMNNFNAAILDV